MIRIEDNTTSPRSPLVDMTPMVDIIFTVIAFMMLIINAPTLTMQLELPSASNAEAADTTAEDITLYVLEEEDRWRIGEGAPTGREATMGTLADQLDAAAAGTDRNVIIAISSTTPTQRLIDTLDMLEDMQVEGVEIMMDPSGDDQ